MNWKSIFLSAVLMPLLAVPVTAAVIWAEPINGDLPNDLPAAPIVPVAPGDNEFFGEILPPTPDPSDSIKLQVLEDQVIDDIIVELTAPSPTDVEIQIRAAMETLDELIRFSIEAPTAGPVSLKDETPIEGPDLVKLLEGLHGFTIKAPNDPGYHVTVIVTPEPSSLALMACGPLMLGFQRRRYRCRN